MSEVKLYKLIKQYRHLLTKQQEYTLKGQIKAGDLQGAYKGLVKTVKGE